MRVSLSADELTGVAGTIAAELERRGHEPLLHGALAESERCDWAWAAEAVARDVAAGRAQQGIVCCWTGTGASIAANKLAGVRAALCLDAATAAGARRWNDANVLALSLRATSQAELAEILDAWFATAPSGSRRPRERRAPGCDRARGAHRRADRASQARARGGRLYKRASLEITSDTHLTPTPSPSPTPPSAARAPGRAEGAGSS